jgi:LysR family transcriptional regulator, regulatory protein for tcuABC
VLPTDAGLAFWQQAQLVLRHADAAVQAAQQQRLSGAVSVGLAPTTAAVLGLPLLLALRERHPGVRLHLVESLSGHLADLLNARRIDLAVIFTADAGRRWSVQPLLRERLYLLAAPALPGLPTSTQPGLAQLAALPMILPSEPHGLRATVDAAFNAAGVRPTVVAEIDSLALLMDAVAAGLGASIQPGAATARLPAGTVQAWPLADAAAQRENLLASLSDDELSPAALAVRVTLADVVRDLVGQGRWPGAVLHAA